MSLYDSIKNIFGSTAEKALNNAKSSAKSDIRKGINNLKKNTENAIKKAVATKTKTFTFASIPTSVEELKALPGGDMKDPFASVAITILALNMYYNDKALGMAAFDYVMGPGALSNLESQRIDMSIMSNGKDPAISYFEGATVENNYTPKLPYTIKVYEYGTSKDIYDQGYFTLFVKSGGADSERQVTVRNKPSTGEWFAHEFSALYMGIKTAKADNPWA